MSVLYAPPSQNAIQKTLAVQLASTATTGDPITFADVTGLQNKPGVLVINRVTSAGVDSSSSREYISYSGISGVTCIIETRNVDGGSSAKTHVVGSIVEFIPDVVWAQSIYTGLSNLLTPSTLAVDLTKVVTPGGSQTLTNKTLTAPTIDVISTRVNPRVVTTTDDATAVIDVDVTDQYQLTAIANATTFTVTGTPVAGQKLIVRLKDAGVAKALTWTGFTSKGATLPTTTVAGKTHYVGLIYNLTDTTWDCVAAIVEA